MNNNIKSLSWWIKFLIIISFIYIIWLFVFPDFIINSFNDSLKNLIEIIPILIFLFFFIFIFNIFLKPETIKKHLWNDSGLKWWFYASIWSLFVMWPPYVILPMLWELKKHWMKNSLIAVFMNTRNIQIVFLPVIAYYFWIKFTIIIFVLSLIFAIINAFIVDKVLKYK